MARVTYSENTKAAIIKAVLDARSANKSWNDAHAIAKKEGYKGNVRCLYKLIIAKKKASKKRGRPAKVKAVATTGLGTVTVRAKKRGRPAKVVTTNLDSVEAIVRRVVQQRVDAALDKAIAALKAMKA
jgi:hypothetical protein